MKNLGFGIIRPGNIAKQFADAINLVEGANITAVASKSILRAKNFAKEFGITYFYNDYDVMCKNTKVDVVYIATTNNFHYDNILICIENNKHVICEKPMVMTKFQAIDVFKKAKEKELFVMEAMWSRFLPSLTKAKDIISSGKIGDVKHISSSFSFLIPYDPKKRLFNTVLGGGVLYDLGVYNISSTMFFTNEKPSEYTGYAKTCPEGTDISDTVIMRFPSGVTAYFYCGAEINSANEMVILGTKGCIVLQGRFHKTQKIILTNEDGSKQTYDFDFQNGFEYQIIEAITCINSKRLQSDIISWQDTSDCIEIIEARLKYWGISKTYL